MFQFQLWECGKTEKEIYG